jgi:uncharacterized repeat protein (TIGR01451 family)
VLDPSSDRTLYAGTDVGAFVSTNSGGTWKRLGNGMPKVAVWQLDYDATNGVLIAGTHGRGAYTLNNRNAAPALVVSKADSGLPVGPDRDVDYTVTVRNLGNAAATGVKVQDPVPGNTTFVSADSGGKLVKGKVTWAGLSVPAGGSVSLKFTVHISSSLPSSVTAIVNDGITVTSDQGVDASGSPHSTAIAPEHAVTVAPASGLEGAKVGAAAKFTETVTNKGFMPDSYALATSGTWTTTAYDSTCTTPLSTTATVQPGESVDVCVKVDVPAGARTRRSPRPRRLTPECPDRRP